MKEEDTIESKKSEKKKDKKKMKDGEKERWPF